MLTLLMNLGLPEQQAKILESQFVSVKKIRSGKFFTKERQVCQDIGVVLKGKFRYYYNTKEGEVTRWISLQNDFVTSLTSFISQKPSKENIQAMEDAEVMIMPRENWLTIYNEHESIRHFWTSIIEANYMGMEERVFNLISKSAEERYEWMQVNQPRFIQEVPDKYLASMLGIHARHLSRIRGIRK